MRQAGRPTSFFEGMGSALEAGRQAGALGGTAVGGLAGSKLGLRLAREIAPGDPALALLLSAPGAVGGAIGGNLVGRGAGMFSAIPAGALVNLPGIRQGRNLLTRPLA